MKQPSIRLPQLSQRPHGQPEQLLVTTFWPNDYALHTEQWIAGKLYQITRYARAADPRFFEVWGVAVSSGQAGVRQRQARRARVYRFPAAA